MKKLLLLLLVFAGFGFNASAQVVVVEKKVVVPATPRPVVVQRVAPAKHGVVQVKHRRHRHPKRVATRTVVVPAPPVVVVKR